MLWCGCGLCSLLATIPVFLTMQVCAGFCAKRPNSIPSGIGSNVTSVCNRCFLLQIIGMYQTSHLPFPSAVSLCIQVAAVAQLNLEIMGLDCIFGSNELDHYNMVRRSVWYPIGAGGLLLAIFTAAWIVSRIRGTDGSTMARDVKERLTSIGSCIFNLL